METPLALLACRAPRSRVRAATGRAVGGHVAGKRRVRRTGLPVDDLRIDARLRGRQPPRGRHRWHNATSEGSRRRGREAPRSRGDAETMARGHHDGETSLRVTLLSACVAADLRAQQAGRVVGDVAQVRLARCSCSVSGLFAVSSTRNRGRSSQFGSSCGAYRRRAGGREVVLQGLVLLRRFRVARRPRRRVLLLLLVVLLAVRAARGLLLLLLVLARGGVGGGARIVGLRLLLAAVAGGGRLLRVALPPRLSAARSRLAGFVGLRLLLLLAGAVRAGVLLRLRAVLGFCPPLSAGLLLPGCVLLLVGRGRRPRPAAARSRHPLADPSVAAAAAAGCCWRCWLSRRCTRSG